MTFEQIPLVLGILVGLLGIAIVADAWQPDGMPPMRERRRRDRVPRHRTGEALVGLGTFALGTALAGRDQWRYGTVAVLLGAVLLLIGGILNRAYLWELLFFRGAARRSEPEADKPPNGRLRIR